jgi:hypothetical protein
MDTTNDSLARTAHAFGITDVEFEARQKELARLARAEESIRQLRLAKEANEPAPMPEVHQNHEERWHDAYEDFDYGYHDQYDF